jgi:hypothetical protein
VKIRELIKFAADFLSPGAAHAPTARHHGVVSKNMKKMKGKTRQSLALSPGLRADASPSDLASHHTWQEPSASDSTIKNWRAKRVLEKTLGRNLDPFAEGARMEASADGPCGCTLKLGDKVTVEGVGRGRVRERNDRMLRVKLESGKYRTVDQKFVHRLL